MEDKSAIILTLVEKTQKYRETGLELVKLKGIDKSAEVLSEVVSKLIILIFSALFFIILNIGIALWLGELFGKNYLGFFTVAAFYAFVTTLIFVFKQQWIIKPVRNSIIIKGLKLAT